MLRFNNSDHGHQWEQFAAVVCFMSSRTTSKNIVGKTESAWAFNNVDLTTANNVVSSTLLPQQLPANRQCKTRLDELVETI